MNQQGDDTELKAAFAEFKELLKRESEPVGASLAPEITLEPRNFAAPSRPQAKETSGSFAKTEHFAPLRPAAPQARVDHGDEALESELVSAPALAEAAEQTRRSRLIYLSLAIVFAGLTGLGVTLVKNSGATSEPAIADIAPPLEPGAEQASLEPPALDEEKASAPKPAVEPAPSEEAEAAPAAEAPAPKAAANAAVPLPGVPPVEDAAPTTASSAPAAPAAPKQAAAPVAAAPIATPAAPPAGGFAPPAAKTSTAALQPATSAVEPEAPAASQPAKPETKAASKPVEKPAKVVKPKTKPAPAQTAAKPPKPPAPAPAVAERAEPAPPPSPAPAAPPPPPPGDNGGAFGFVKRTVNSVGSTIGDLGRSVIP